MTDITVPHGGSRDGWIWISVNGVEQWVKAGEPTDLDTSEIEVLDHAGIGYTFAPGGDGDGFDWDPEGVTFGIDFQTDRIFDGETTTDDYTAVLGDGFDPDEVSALGIAIFEANANRPNIIGPLLDQVATNDYTCVIFFRKSLFVTPTQALLTAYDTDQTGGVWVAMENSTTTYATESASGGYDNIGAVRAFSDNVVAFSLTADGILSSLNGATAILTDGQVVTAIEKAGLGCEPDGGHYLEGWIKAIIFYPSTDVAAEVEAYSANAAPANSVAPVISGTAQVGETLSITTGTWTGSPTSYEYQWYRDNASPDGLVVGATADTLLLTITELGTTMLCVVYAVNVDGIGGISVSDNTTVIAA